MKELIKRHLVFVDAEQTMTEIVATMRDQNISSVLVLNHDREVVGIVTERDIVQKFTLLEKQEKLHASVAAFMTRPVSFARLAHLEDDVRTMFFERRLRHFPVSDGSNHAKDILGMLTVTDMTSAYLKSAQSLKKDLIRESLVIVSRDVGTRQRYKKLFEALNFTVITGGDIDQLVQQAITRVLPIVFDIDDLGMEEAQKDLARLKTHRGVFILLSSQPKLVEPLKKLLNNELHCVALKPLDISYILLLLSRLHHDAARAS
ncbi:CBS domain-containing protein [Oligoflexus tunisiensis]|uniref:CBS domain-containing protein n=1 Tax=Oligoflexus tunisiensis TaxID=708132 RepID=UPI000B292F5C|nr:CBS domain-containing protein [Oligoflexus tunisiensis]